MKFLSQVARQDTPNVNTCTAEQRVGGVVHSKQSLDSWNTSQLEKTERYMFVVISLTVVFYTPAKNSKQLCDVLGRLREDIGGQVPITPHSLQNVQLICLYCSVH